MISRLTSIEPPKRKSIVRGGEAPLFNGSTWARYGAMPVDGTNTYTAMAKDAYGRSDTNTVSVFLPVSTSFAYDLNGNMLSDGRRGFEYDDETLQSSGDDCMWAVEKIGKLTGPWVYRTCIFAYGVVCAQQKRECDQWNKDRGF